MTIPQMATRILATIVLIGAGVAGRAEAAPIISFSPSAQQVSLGDTVTVDVNIAGLAPGESVGGAAFELSFDTGILAGSSYILDPDGKMGFALNPIDNDFSLGFPGTSPMDVFFLADVSLDNHAALKALQGDGFRLASISFTAIGEGLSLLGLGVHPFAGAFLSDALGSELAATAQNGSVCVGGNCGVTLPDDVTPVPEPATMALLGSGLAALIAKRRRQARTEG